MVCFFWIRKWYYSGVYGSKWFIELPLIFTSLSHAAVNTAKSIQQLAFPLTCNVAALLFIVLQLYCCQWVGKERIVCGGSDKNMIRVVEKTTLGVSSYRFLWCPKPAVFSLLISQVSALTSLLNSPNSWGPLSQFVIKSVRAVWLSLLIVWKKTGLDWFLNNEIRRRTQQGQTCT